MSKGATASLKSKSNKNFVDKKISKFGDIVIKMLPEHLTFTVFLTSEEAFERDLRLNPTESLASKKVNDTYAILTRIVRFSTVPRTIFSADLHYGKDIVYDSISASNLYILKDLDGMLVVNRVVSEHIDLKLVNILVHVMNGEIKDSEFEESMQLDDDEEEN